MKVDIQSSSGSGLLFAAYDKVKSVSCNIWDTYISDCAAILSNVSLHCLCNEEADFDCIGTNYLQRWVAIEEERDVREASVAESSKERAAVLTKQDASVSASWKSKRSFENVATVHIAVLLLPKVVNLFQSKVHLAKRTGLLMFSDALCCPKQAFPETRY